MSILKDYSFIQFVSVCACVCDTLTYTQLCQGTRAHRLTVQYTQSSEGEHIDFRRKCAKSQFSPSSLCDLGMQLRCSDSTVGFSTQPSYQPQIKFFFFYLCPYDSLVRGVQKTTQTTYAVADTLSCLTELEGPIIEDIT